MEHLPRRSRGWWRHNAPALGPMISMIRSGGAAVGKVTTHSSARDHGHVHARVADTQYFQLNQTDPRQEQEQPRAACRGRSTHYFFPLFV